MTSRMLVAMMGIVTLVLILSFSPSSNSSLHSSPMPSAGHVMAQSNDTWNVTSRSVLTVTATPANPNPGDTVILQVMSIVTVTQAHNVTVAQTTTTGNNTTTSYQNYTVYTNVTEPSPGPVSISVRGPYASLLPGTCLYCPLNNGTLVDFIAVNDSLGFHTIDVSVEDLHTGQFALTWFTVTLTPQQIVDRVNRTLAGFLSNQSAYDSARQGARDLQQDEWLAGIAAIILVAEARRSYKSAQARNEPTWVDNVKGVFGVRRNPLMKVMRSDATLYAAAKESMKRKEVRFNRRVVGRALADHLKLLEAGRTILNREVELSRVIRSTRVAQGLPSEPGMNVAGLKVAKFDRDGKLMTEPASKGAK